MTVGAPLTVVTAADERYAMPLAVMGRSLLDHLPPCQRVRLFVVSGGLGERARRRIDASWDLERAEVTWLVPDLAPLRHAKVSGHTGLVTYFRLLIGSALPAEVERVIYLDADVMVESDLGELWNLDLAGHTLGAARDWIVLTVSATNGLATWRELDLDPGQTYFNAGVLLVDLARWRRDGVERRLLAYLEEHRAKVRWWDQDALNAVLGRDCLELNPRWNLNIRDATFPSPDSLPFSLREYEAVVTSPRVCHFATHIKPWHTDCSHPRREQFFHYLDETAWAGWRPIRSSSGRIDLRAIGARLWRRQRRRRS